MAQIKITWPAPPADGTELKFKAPCDCTAVTGILLSYPAADGSEGTQTFTFRDAHGNNLAGLGNLFGAGAYVKVILDTVNGFAYIQNADTNAYIERLVSDSVETAKTQLTNSIETAKTQLTNSIEEVKSQLSGTDELWSGSWSKGNLTVPNTGKYSVFSISLDGIGTNILAMKKSSHIRGVGGYATSDALVTYQFTATFSGNVWTFVACTALEHTKTSGHASFSEKTVNGITGIV